MPGPPTPRRKRLSYRAQNNRDLVEREVHWTGFTFQGGPWQCILKGPHGQIQVWASSSQEGSRVIAHVCADAGIDPRAPENEYTAREIAGKRPGQSGTFRVRQLRHGVHVTAREGPAGPPEIVVNNDQY